MNAKQLISDFLANLPEPKQTEMNALHNCIMEILPGCRLWFLDGKDEQGKIVSNPNIGYGQQTLETAGGKNREFYQIGISPNTTGISVYFMGLKDKTYILQTYGKDMGRATITGYCLKFKSLKDINRDVLDTAIRDVFEQTK